MNRCTKCNKPLMGIVLVNSVCGTSRTEYPECCPSCTSGLTPRPTRTLQDKVNQLIEDEYRVGCYNRKGLAVQTIFVEIIKKCYNDDLAVELCFKNALEKVDEKQ